MAYLKFIVTGTICAVLGSGLAVAQDTFGGAQQQTQPPGNFPQQPGGFPQQPGNYPQQPGGFPQQPGGVQQPGANPGQLTQMEQTNFGVQPTSQLYSGQMHSPTPTSIPGGQVVTTQALVALVQGNQTPYFLFDVLGGPEKLPNAVPAAWVAQPGSFNDQTQQQFAQMLQQGTQGRKDIALVFYCLSNQCWMSYNAALRAINAGYTKVLWYRGGIEAWKMAGLPTQPSQQGFSPQQR
jgi:PQQ-dependent catabolism-associated CXXCW motif protein